MIATLLTAFDPIHAMIGFIVFCVCLAVVIILARWIISLTGIVIPQPLLYVLGLLLFLMLLFVFLDWIGVYSFGGEVLAVLRRTFIAAVALGWSALLTGCSWETDLLNWIPVGLSAVSSILSLLTGAGIILGPGVVPLIGLIQVGLDDLRLAIVEYQSTTPPPVGTLAKIDAFLGDLINNLGNVIGQLPAAPITALAIALLKLVLDTLSGFFAKVPMAATSMAKTKMALSRMATIRDPHGLVIGVTPATDVSRRHFIKTFNALASAGGHPEAALPLSPAQHL